MEEAQPLLPRNDDEIINQPASDAVENPSPSNNFSSSSKLVPESDQPQSSDMEVHHHAHHNGKKNWKAYFWEFLMLFLAVFCGFLAEYLLEQGARIDLFAAAMLGKRSIVETSISQFPQMKQALGPHGIPLLDHAKAGGDTAVEIVKFLEEA